MEQKQDNRAVLLISFGTRYREAREKSLERIYQDMIRESKIAVYQAYTSRTVIQKLARQGIYVNTLPEAVNRIIQDGIRRLYVVVTHMIPGLEYHRLRAELERYRGAFEQLETAGSVLENREDCAGVAAVLQEILRFQPEKEYILMGHGTEAEANIRYEQMNEIFRNEGLTNVRIASVEARPDLEDALSEMRKPDQTEAVVLHPFMVVAGDHAIHDMAGEGDSFASRLKQCGYRTETVIKGLGEYPQFRRIYADRLKKMMQERQ